MKNNGEKKTVSMTAKILAGSLAALLLFGSIASVLFYIIG
jgi:hypothetical protein